MLRFLLAVGVGSFFGGALRYLISNALKTDAGHFPLPTLLVNLVGCLLIGFVYGLVIKHTTIPRELVLLLTTGFCGGFTTFSTFANEGLLLIEHHNYWLLFAYILLSIVGGLILVASGYQLARLF
ncbi:MAG: fluoride efflux transporter CrcB [Prevotellaceae bacterium]|nr:fluoride efflux transporter CrcB [Prevotellaceae bacterium]